MNGLDLIVMRGECFGLLGPNGAGKTTSIEILEGLLQADAGDVEVLGMRWERDAVTLRARLGIQLQDTQLADKLTVAETLRLFRSFYPSGPTVDALLDTVELSSKRDAWVSKLSGGQKQRLSVSGLMNLVMLPMWVLSGVFFASTNFPDAMQPFIHVLPLTALNDAMRAVVNEGRSLAQVLPQIATLSVWGGVSFVLSLKLFRWQ